jgi:hypothetical protein
MLREHIRVKDCQVYDGDNGRGGGVPAGERLRCASKPVEAHRAMTEFAEGPTAWLPPFMR